MSDIKDFNIILNRSTKDRFVRWTDYRNSITDFIIDQAKSFRDSYSSCLVIGCGNSDDIDLSRIAKLTKVLNVSDIDIKSMESALEKYEVSNTSVNILPVDYSGLDDDNTWNEFLTLCLENPLEVTVSKLEKMFIQVMNYNFLLDHKGEYDLVIVSPIYTQLLLNQFMMNLEILAQLNYPRISLELLKERFMQYMPEVLTNFNRNILELASSEALIIGIADVMEFGKVSSEYSRILDIADNQEQLAAYHSAYLAEYGYGLGDYGLANLESKAKSTYNKWFLWDFNDSRLLLVKAIAMIKQ